MKIVPTQRGFTLFEILIVFSIVAILLTIGITSWKGVLQHGFDAQRKSDLSKLKAVLEHYATDHGCYPADYQMGCTSTIFAAYNMPKVLCDPESHLPYLYQLVDSSDPCKGYRLYTILRDLNDLNIAQAGCNKVTGCGINGYPQYNYGVSSGVPVAQ